MHLPAKVLHNYLKELHDSQIFRLQSNGKGLQYVNHVTHNDNCVMISGNEESTFE